ncbi:hypothetical protein PENTCL1PPCAC_22409 [Pristionchus entomophagus]|uniref:Sushi domain-containing protein n=1 Tax=Pristionchus entomophagus TaxID=358040 RepID=A0AAV5U1C7_9BILA|nr:hypothetical protein PENTCL1PPCAC_22409 [Pristionchus entomophagus]
MRLLTLLLLPTVTFSCMRTSTPTTGNRAAVSQNARLAQRSPLPCIVSSFRLCLEGWICDSSSISIEDSHLKCVDGSAILVKEVNSQILATKTQCKDKRWLINDKPFPKEVEATCGSVVPRGKSLRNGEAAEDKHTAQESPTTETPNQSNRSRDEWIGQMREVQERMNENMRLRRRVVQNLMELRKKGVDRETIQRIQNEIAGHNTIHHELYLIMNRLRNEKRGGISTISTTGQRLPQESSSLVSSPHIPSYAELLALQGYEAMPQIYAARPPNPFDDTSIDNIPSSFLRPYTSYRRCGRITQSTSDCPDGRVCSSFSHQGEHRVTCPNGHIALELPSGHLELMVSSLVCPEDGWEWTAETKEGQRGQRLGVHVAATCIQECACTPLSASPICPPSQRCSPASFLIDMDDQCMLYECGQGANLFIRSRYGWRPASHLVCGPGGDYLVEGKETVGPNPTVTCVVDGNRHYSSHHRRRGTRGKIYN